MHHSTDRIAHTTAFVTPVVEHWLYFVEFMGYFYDTLIFITRNIFIRNPPDEFQTD